MPVPPASSAFSDHLDCSMFWQVLTVHFSIILQSGVTMPNSIAENIDNCGQQNIEQSYCFQQLDKLCVFTHVHCRNAKITVQYGNACCSAVKKTSCSLQMHLVFHMESMMQTDSNVCVSRNCTLTKQ